MLLTLTPAELASVATKASTSSLADEVESWLLVILELAADESFVAVASMATALQHRTWTSKTIRKILINDFIGPVLLHWSY
jgi:hypothetical protein